ncbi:MAG: hypothetical protein HKO57_13905, partial [Akkermansiaceae bacterium]|nr:hypothetical protein [Akkermansiaceae bacterium]
TIPAGAYLVSVKKGNATATATVEVEAGKDTTGHIVIGSGFLKPRAVMSAGMEPFDDKGLKWDVLTPPNDEGKRKSVAYSYDAAPKFSIPSGSYLLRVTRGQATTEQDVEVSSGETTEALLNLNAALLRPTASMTEGGEVFNDRGLKWEVYGPPNAEGKRANVAYSYDAQPTFVLPAGTYQVVVKRESAATTLDDVTVETGKLNGAHAVLDAGLVKLTLADASGSPVSGSHWWDVFGPPNAEGKRAKVAYSNKPTPTVVLRAGPYLVKAKAGDRTAEAEMQVEAGKLSEFTVKLAE